MVPLIFNGLPLRQCELRLRKTGYPEALSVSAVRL